MSITAIVTCLWRKCLAFELNQSASLSEHEGYATVINYGQVNINRLLITIRLLNGQIEQIFRAPVSSA